MLTLDQLGISEGDWNQTPASVRTALMFLLHDPEPARRQLSELPPVKAEVTEYRRHTLHCLHCGAQTRAEWPEELPSGSFGPRAQAIVAYLTGRLGTRSHYGPSCERAFHQRPALTLQPIYKKAFGLANEDFNIHPEFPRAFGALAPVIFPA